MLGKVTVPRIGVKSIQIVLTLVCGLARVQDQLWVLGSDHGIWKSLSDDFVWAIEGEVGQR